MDVIYRLGRATAQDVLEQIPGPAELFGGAGALALARGAGPRAARDGRAEVRLLAGGGTERCAAKCALPTWCGRSSEARSSRPSRRSSIRHGPSSRTEELDRLSDLIDESQEGGTLK